MGRYVTPAGVEIEMGDAAARSVGYKPVEKPKPAPKKKADTKPAGDES